MDYHCVIEKPNENLNIPRISTDIMNNNNPLIIPDTKVRHSHNQIQGGNELTGNNYGNNTNYGSQKIMKNENLDSTENNEYIDIHNIPKKKKRNRRKLLQGGNDVINNNYFSKKDI